MSQVIETESPIEVESPAGQEGFRQRIAVQKGSRLELLPLKEIDWIEADRKHVRLHAGNKIHRMRQTLTELKRSLDPRRFLQVHRSNIVNVESISTLDLSTPLRPFLVLKDGKRVAVARSYKKSLRDILTRGTIC